MAGSLKTNQKALVTEKTRVLILDDLPVVRERVAQLVESEPDLMVCGEADDAREAMKISAATQPRLVVTSLSLKNSHSLDFIKDLHSHYPQVLILVFSMYDELVYAERAIRAGALYVDVKTIETYRSRIKVKLNLATAAELAHYARTWLEESTRAL
jgi:DNA-binding NarL/FixJ family response regulator